MKNREKINVMIFETIFHLGGAEKITYEIVKRMNKEKYNFVLCTLYHPGPMGDVFINDGYRFYHDLIKSKFDITAFFKLRKIIVENKIDLIYLINQPLTLFWGFISGKACKVPVVSVIHNTVVIRERMKLRIYKLMLPFISRIVTVANIQKEHLVRNEKIPESLISVIYNGVEINNLTAPVKNIESIRSLGLDAFSKTVGIVTRLVRLKGVDIFLHAARLILQRNEKVQFLIVGDGPEMSKMKSIATELNIDKRIHFLGVRDDIAELVALFDVAVMSSRTEALPMVLLEYMASSKAIVATLVGSIPELVTDGESGFLVEPENPDALAEKILLLLNNEELAESFGHNAREIVKKRFRIEIAVEKTEALIDEVVGK